REKMIWHIERETAQKRGMVSIQSNYSPNRSKQEFYTLDCFDHRVRVIVTAAPSIVRRWVHTTLYLHRHILRRGRLSVGLGVQWPPDRPYDPSTLQLCVGRRCLVFQIHHADACPAVLRRFLSDARVTFVGAWNHRDADLLRDSPHRLRISRLLDVRDVADDRRGCGRRLSLERLAEEILGWDGIVKEERVGRSAWDDDWLTEEQVEYACVDVFVVFKMAKVLRAWNWPLGFVDNVFGNWFIVVLWIVYAFGC
ncbi:polynucleotidyl transferase, partial [Striga asiatica]